MNADEMAPVFISMPFAEFLDTFVPGPALPKDHKEVLNFDSVNFDVKEEEDLYSDLHRVMGSALTNSKLVSRDTADWPQRGDDRAFDGGIFDSNCPTAIAAYNMGEDFKKTSKVRNKLRLIHAARVAWSHVVVPVEVKINEEAEGFGANGKPFLPASQKHQATRGQLTEYATEVLLRQHREFLFMIYFFRSTVRIIRWDRVGAIVTEPIDVKEMPEPFLTFIYRIGEMKAEQLGYDTTVSLASDEEIKLMEPQYFSKVSDRMRKHLQLGLKSAGWPIHKIQVHDRTEGRTRSFLVGKPCAASYSPVGRCTKGYYAFDIESKRFTFLKDSWRADLSTHHPECEVYGDLHNAKVRNIAKVVCGGDVGDWEGHTRQRTRTQHFLPSGKALPARLHYRIVLDKIGVPLEEYECSQEMCMVIYDSLLAHKDAWDKAHILHRDISDGNILIDESCLVEGQIKGLLIDWDLCKYESELSAGPTQKGRSGTWRFLSALLLKYPKKRYELSDDIESFVHLVNWLTLRFHEHNLGSSNDLSNHIREMYEECTTADGFHIGSEQKFVSMSQGLRMWRLRRPENLPLSNLIDRLSSFCKAHYQAIDHDALAPFCVKPEQLAGPKKETSRLKLQPAVRTKRPKLKLDGDRYESLDVDDYDKFVPKPVVTELSGLVLEDHKYIIKTFQRALEEEEWEDNDKVAIDQFAGLEIFNPKSRTARGSSCSKRKSMDAGEAEGSEQSTKKSKSNSGVARSAAPKESSGQLGAVEEE